MEIRKLLKQGFSQLKIAEKLVISRTTVYRHLEKSPSVMTEWIDSLQFKKKKYPHKELILSWLRMHPDTSAAQVGWLLEKYEDINNIGESTVRSYVKALREEYKIKKKTIPRMYEAIPDPPMGEQLQVDFGDTKQRTIDNKEVKLSFIAFVLSHSRFKYNEWLVRSLPHRMLYELMRMLLNGMRNNKDFY